MAKPRASVLISRQMLQDCFLEEDIQDLTELTDLRTPDTDQVTDEWQKEAMAGADIVITGWGSRRLTDDMLDAAPDLKLVCHSAGSIKGIYNPSMRERGIRVMSAAAANSQTVAEFAFGMMIVSMKGVWQYHADTMQGIWSRGRSIDWVREPFGATVGIIAASISGRGLIDLCHKLPLKEILVYDPYITEQEATALGARKASLEELMRESDVVSLHAPNIPETRHMINAENLAMMKDKAIFINTARGACVDEEALIAELQKGRILACLDVTAPKEPPEEGSPLYSLPNCILTPHIAGDIKESRQLQGRSVRDNIAAYLSGRSMPHEVNLEIIDRLA
jgi:phosphoglycerate dehydrogenase-like enzyme